MTAISQGNSWTSKDTGGTLKISIQGRGTQTPYSFTEIQYFFEKS